MSSDTDWTTASSSRESKVLGIAFDIVLVSSRCCHSESLINLFGYKESKIQRSTLKTRTVNMSKSRCRRIVH